MKKLLLIWLLIISVTVVHAQILPVDSETGKVMYTDVVSVDGSKTELFSRGKKWIAHTFRSASNVIQAEDKEEGYIVIKGLSYIDLTSTFRRVFSELEVPMHFTLSLDFKDGAYRYRFTDIYFQPQAGANGITIPIEDALLDSLQYEKKAIEELKSAGINPTKKIVKEGVALGIDVNSQYKSKAHSTIKGIIELLKTGMIESKNY